MRHRSSGQIDIGPPQKTGDSWYFAPRPSESLDAAEVTIITGPDREGEGDSDSDAQSEQED